MRSRQASTEVDERAGDHRHAVRIVGTRDHPGTAAGAHGYGRRLVRSGDAGLALTAVRLLPVRAGAAFPGQDGSGADEGGDVPSGLAGELRQDAGVGVGGDGVPPEYSIT
jgi:hypothetical protein